jgi:hypothetical protein
LALCFSSGGSSSLGGPWLFSARSWATRESRYSAFDRELLAVHSAVLHFRHLLEGRQFTIFSDHKPLTGALSRVSEPRSDRQRRQLSFIVEFVSEIKHIAGRANIVTDTLSRPHNTLKYLLLAWKQKTSIQIWYYMRHLRLLILHFTFLKTQNFGMKKKLASFAEKSMCDYDLGC